MSEKEKFEIECKNNIELQGENESLNQAKIDFLKESIDSRYSYNFKWMGRPIIQYPQDIVIMQELIWEIKPDLIIETGIAHGGSLILYASILELIGKGEVLGIDIDIREHNKKEILDHPMSKRISMIEGSSIDPVIVDKVKAIAKDKETIMVLFDSNHSHEHVMEELKAYANLTTVGSYCVVFDTVVEDLPKAIYNDRPWDVGSNPKTAVFDFLKTNDNFEIDKGIDNKILISVAPDGYLKRVK